MTASRIFFMMIFSIIFRISSYPQQTHWVTSSSDAGPGTLRDAVENSGPGDIVRFMPNITTVLLQSEEILINKPLSIIGNEGLTIIRRNQSPSTPHFRILNINSESKETDTLYLKNLAIKNGLSADGDIEDLNGRNGGAILVSSSNMVLKLSDCEFYNNKCGNGYSNDKTIEKNSSRATAGAGGSGGAIFSNAALIITSCSFEANQTGKGGDVDLGNVSHSVYAGSGGSGGAVFSNGYLRVYDCEFTDNQTNTGGTIEASSDNYITAYAGSAGSGGAIYALSGGGIFQTVFENNKCGNGASGKGYGWVQGRGGYGGNGAAVYCMNGSFEIAGSLFHGNLTGDGGTGTGTAGLGGGGGNGAAIFAINAAIDITGCTFQDNMAGNGNSGTGGQSGGGGSGGNGGCLFVKDCGLNCKNSIFQNNQTGEGGYGGSYYSSYSGWGGFGGAAYAENTAGSISLSDFDGNKTNIAGNAYASGPNSYANARSGGSGGAILMKNNCHLEINSCKFRNNSTADGGHMTGPGDTTRHGGNGGNGGAISLTGSSSAEIINCLISGNSTGVGGVNNADTTKTGNNGNGGGISLSGGSMLSMINSTIAGNTTGITGPAYSYHPQPGQGGGIFVADTTLTLVNTLVGINTINDIGSVIENDLFGDYLLDHCFILDTSGYVYSGIGNIFLRDPVFAGFPENLEVLPMSPAINNGKPDTTGLNLPVLELNLNQRIFQRIDIGAYEYPFALNDSLEILPSSVNFGDVIVGTSGYDSLQLINRGNSTLILDSLLFPSGYLIRPADEIWTTRVDSIVIYPGEAAKFELSFIPQAPEIYLDSAIIFSNNLPDLYKIVLQGTGIPAIPIEITSDCEDSILVGQTYLCHAEINTYNGFPWSYSVLEKPGWINIYPVSENVLEITGRSNEQDTGHFLIHFILVDSLTAADFYQEIEVALPVPPTFQHSCSLSVLTGQQYQCAVTASDLNLLPVDLTITDYPGWITWNKPEDDRIEISGIPGSNDVGIAVLAFFASDSLAGNHLSFEITVGVDGVVTQEIDGRSPDISFFPNPASEGLILEVSGLSAGIDYKMVIYDMFGRAVLSLPGLPADMTNEEDFRWHLDVSSLPAGFYIAVVRNELGMVARGKFLAQPHR